MKKLCSSADSAEIGLLRNRLESAGIECEIRNECTSSVMPLAPFEPELWILQDEQFAEATELLAAWQKPGPDPESHGQ
jgi:Putative prokaryotic signal transducing protein